MWNPTDKNPTARLDLLEMAFQTQVRVALGEQLSVDAAVRRMARGAALAKRLVLEHKRPALHLMALRAVFLLRKQLRAAAGVGDALVRRMALDAGHPAFGHGMVARQIELAAHIRVALVARGFNRARRFERESSTQDFRLRPSGGETEWRFDVAALILVQAGRPVAGFAAGV